MEKCEKENDGILIKKTLEKILYSLRNKKFNNPTDSLMFGYIIANIFNNNQMKLEDGLIENLFIEFQNSNMKSIDYIYNNLLNYSISLEKLSLAKIDSDDFCLFGDSDNNNFNINEIDDDKNKINNNNNIINEDKNIINEIKKPQHLDYNINSIIGPEDYEDYNEINIESKIECPICLEEYECANQQNYYLDCGCIIHESCFDEYIENEIIAGKVPIKCPYCNKIDVNELYIKDSLKKNNKGKLIQKFENFSMNYYILQHPKDTSCCPTVGCNYIFIYEDGDNYFGCPLCDKEYCLKCKTDWHEGETCEEYSLKKDVKKLDNLFQNFVRGSNFKRCPYCQRWVEKNEGCNHIACLCGNHFCYRCGAKMNGKIYEHLCKDLEEDRNYNVRNNIIRNNIRYIQMRNNNNNSERWKVKKKNKKKNKKKK